MKDILLTIGIPTWNRATDIRTAIDSIVIQLTEDVYKKTEILVSDNASTDHTPFVLAEYKIRYPGLISIYRNPQNIGFSGNLDVIVRRAKGEFVLFLSDDDAVEPDAVKETFFALNKHRDINVMFLQHWPYNTTLSAPENLEQWTESRKQRETGQSCVYYKSGAEFYKAYHSLCNACISGNLFRVEAWKSTNMDSGLKSGSVQLHAAIQIHAKGTSCFITRPVIKYRISSDSGDINTNGDYIKERVGGYDTGYTFVYFFDLLRACREGQHLYPVWIYRRLSLSCVRGVFYILLSTKARSLPINKSYFLTRLNECFDHNYWYWLIPFHRVLINIPNWLLILPHHLYRLGQTTYLCIKK